MKLHHTVFLTAFIISLCLSALLSTVFSSANFKKEMDMQKKLSVSSHEIFIQSIKSKITAKQIEKNGFILLSEDIKDVIKKEADNESVPCIFVFQEDVLPLGIEISEKANTMLNNTSISSGKAAIYNDNANDRIFVCSAFEICERKISLLTAYDTEKTIAFYRSTFKNQMVASFIISFALSAFIALIVMAKTARLKMIDSALISISKGDYGKRVQAKGCYEVKQLAKDLNRTAESVNAQAEKLNDISESRKRFVDNMAHEMKTPLTSIMCMADILRIKRNIKEKELRENANVIFEEAKRMKALSSKLLLLAETDNSGITKEPVSAKELMDEISMAILPIADQAGIKLSFYCENVWLFVDKQLFKTMIFNLIDNAVKASEPGKQVEVHCFSERSKIRLLVADQGTGMSEYDLKHALEPFYRADKARSRKAGGVGLGLPLCASIAKKHGALFEIKSEKGVGTVVMIETDEYIEPDYENE